LVRVGEALVAAGLAALTSISLCAWMMQGSAPADALSRAVDSSDSPETTGSITSFDARFSFDQSISPGRSAGSSSSFEDRFVAPGLPAGVAVRTTTVSPATAARAADPAASAANVAARERASRLAAATPSVVAERAPNRPAARYRVASLSDTPPPTAYAPTDATTRDPGINDLLKRRARNPASEAAPKDAATKDADPLASDPSHTAIYDISARTVYLPNGERLEAHSGLGGFMDDVRSVHLRSRGPTPPNVYDLTLREAPFHGVQAIRLTAVDGNKMYGRDGILVHPFMLGPEGASNGCVSVKDYPAFLKAYQRGDITRLVVVEQLDDPPGGRTAADWFSSAWKRLFGPS
jgi:hypothetical protein